MTTTAAIITEQVSKAFPGSARPAVDRCSFAAEAGEFVVLLGSSGCGKTTLLKMINRLYEPTSGRILFNGTDVTALPVTQLRRQIGYVIQQTGLFPHLSVASNIAIVPRLLNWERARIDHRIDELLELVGLPPDYRNRFPRQLSGGEQQRIGIARALAADPAVMLMDEPFGAIDAITRGRLQGELLQIQQRLHKTILFVTHDVDEAFRLADRIIVMSQGHIVQYDTPLRLLLNPADPFVAKLLGADDVVRRLSLLPVDHVMRPAIQAQEITGLPTVQQGGTLRTVLADLLASGAEQVVVIDDTDRPLGVVAFDDIQRAVRPAFSVTT